MGSVPNETNYITPLSHQRTTLRIAVIGGGIGGLSLVLGLLKYPHIDVQVYESAPSFGEIGAGITCGPNAQRALELIGPEAYTAFKSYATGNAWTDHANNYTLNRVGYGERDGEIIIAQRNRTGMQSAHRAKFLDELVKPIPNQRAHFRWDDGHNGRGLRSLESDGGLASVAADSLGQVIGADCIHSATRSHVLGDSHPAARPVCTGTASSRALCSMDKAIESLGEEYAMNSQMLTGPGRGILSYPIESGAVLNIVLMDYDQPKWEHEKWIVPTTAKEVHERLSGWGETAHKLIDLMDDPDLRKWAIFDHPPAPYYKPRVAIMGDAAHATTPYQGQGAAQAIEDALVLETLLGSITDKRHLPNVFAAYDQVRRPRSQRVVSTSRESGQLLGRKQEGVGADLRKMREKIDTRMRWVWNRDLVAQNESALKILRESF